MNDRELLEYAAKAAGFVIDEYPRNERSWAWVYRSVDRPNAVGQRLLFKWNPRNDDGAALRLAVKLQISVEQWPDSGDGEGSYCLTGDCIFEHHKNDSESATRLAIVRAAAEIGKLMENK